ncbi:MAG: hypothetical protein JWQ27_16 [Ferruginibacter sp.]|nr:hypothetical protein [Ferruginibacter sp.]
MKKLCTLLAIIAGTTFQYSFAQDSSAATSPALLNSYYQLKDNLVKSRASTVALSAASMVSVLNELAEGLIDGGLRTSLLKDARSISQTKDLDLQREKFAGLSATMVKLGQTMKLSSHPVYQQYCPMKKASWLSADMAIKNPYYGNAMLTCGVVKATF